MIIGLICTFSGILTAEDTVHFDTYFTSRTMRLDYFQTGTASQNSYSFDDVYIEPYWAGSETSLIDTLNLGKYRFEVFDLYTNTQIYSRGFCSVFGEWQTTDEAKKRNRSFSESLRFPLPKRSVKVTISDRDRENNFHEVWSVTIDPDDPNIVRTVFYPEFKVKSLLHSGDPIEKVDILFLPDGYSRGEMKKFFKDARRMTDILFGTSPFAEYKTDFNVWAIEAPSHESGIDNPQKGVYRDNLLSCSFNSFGSDRYILTYDNKTVRKLAARAPYDFVYILVNSSKYGGGGIFNLYATCVSDNEWSDYILVHEFGHLFAGLGDEYYTSDVAYSEFYPTDVEPWEPNITALLDPDHLKWKSLIEPDTPIPTPWNKDVYDSVNNAYARERKLVKSDAARDSLVKAHDQWTQDFYHSQPYWGKVGAFEGSGYASKGLFRPFIDCRMFSRGLTGFDPVCTRTIIRTIRFYTGSR